MSAAGFISPFAVAGPTGGQVMTGTGTIAQSGSTTTVKQSSQNLSLNWATFNIAPQETVDFVQPSASAIAVNRIFDANGSQILGHLNANGQVYLINPNGVLFGASAQVNVGGLVASTLDVSDASLGSNTRSFSSGGTGSVVNQGTINAANGGYVALLGNHVSNRGTITAQLGTVALGAGSAVTLTFSGDSLVHVQVDQSVLNSLAENGGLIRADGGTVVMTAGAAKSLLASVVNNTGVIEARTVQNLGSDQSGTITLLGGMTAGTVDVGGTLDASAPNGGNGGAIETSAADVKIAGSAAVTTAAPHGLYGSWLIDPNDYTVEASGGNETGTALSAALNSGNVTILSSSGSAGSGNVNIDDAVSWFTNTTLTLTASNNVNVNSSVTASGASAGIVINPNITNGGQSATGSGVFSMGPGGVINLPGVSSSSTTALLIGGASFSVINNVAALQAINTNSTTLGRNYALGSNISASSGFTPIGMSSGYGTAFSGIFDGLGHIINGLGISVSSSTYSQQGWGLFGASTGTIRNVGLTGGSVTASGVGFVGGLVGANYGTITNSFSTNSVTASGGSTRIGGLVGFNYGATVTKSYASSTVNGGSDGSYVGGLIGWSEASTVSNSFATGNVSGGSYVGGLIGWHGGGTSTGRTGLLTNSYATGSVSGGSYVGGLVGLNFDYSGTATISNTYAAGYVTGTANVGGLVGQNTNAFGGTATVATSFWNNSSPNNSLSGIGSNGGSSASTSGATGRSSANLEQSAATIGSGAWSTSIWTIYNGATYPLLQSFMTPLTVTANNQTTTYNGTQFSGGNGVTFTSYGATVSPVLSGSLVYTGSSQGAKHAGSYNITPAGLDSGQLGYLITDANGILTIDPRTLTPTLTNSGVIRSYNGNSNAPSGFTPTYSFSGLASGDTGATLANTGAAYNSAHVASATSLTVSGLSVSGIVGSNGSLASDYTLSSVTASVAAAITPASLTVGLSNATNVTKTYDGTTAAPSGFTPTYSITGLVSGDSATVSGSTPVYNSAHVASATAITQGGLSLASITGSGGDNSVLSDYTLARTTASTGNGIASISPLTLTATAPTIGGITTKVYDGTTSATGATLSGGGVSGALSGDTVSLDTSGVSLSYNSSHVSSASSIGAGGSLSVDIVSSTNGSQSTDYSVALPSIASVAGTITPATLTVSLSNTGNVTKTFDGTAAAPSGFTPTYSITGLVSGDSATVSSGSTPVFNSAHVVSATVISQGGLSLASVTGVDNSVLSDYSLSSTTASTGIWVASITSALLTATAPTIGGITTKVYDGTTVATGATLSGGGVSGAVSGDTLTLSTSGINLDYNSNHVASANSIGASGSLSLNIVSSTNGSQSTDYSVALPSIASVAGTITPATLTANLSNRTNATKTYDGTTAAPSGFSPTYSITGLVSGDSATVSGSTPIYNSAHVASATAITQGGLSLSSVTGNGSDNSLLSDYTLANTTASTGNTIASITPALVTASAPTIGGITTKVYDGTTVATGAILSRGVVSGAVSGDTLTLNTSGINLNYNSSHVASANSIGASGSLSLNIGSSANGSQRTDYSVALPSIASVAGTITPATLTANLSNTTNVTKTYDGTTAAPSGFSPTYSITGLVSGDSATVSGSTPIYNSAHVASATAITQGGLSLASVTGNGSDNSLLSDYTLANTTASTGNGIASIAPALVTASAPTIGGITTKVYDGTTAATGATLSGGVVSGAVSGDTLALNTSEISLNYNTAQTTATTISASGSASLDISSSTFGSLSSDYSLTQPVIASVPGTITAAPVSAPTSTPVPADLPSPLLLVFQPGTQSEAGRCMVMAARAGCAEESGQPAATSESKLSTGGADTRVGLNLHVVEGGVRLPDHLIIGQ